MRKMGMIERVAVGLAAVIVGTGCGGGTRPSRIRSVATTTSAAPTTAAATITTLASLGGPLPTGPAQATTAPPPIGGTTTTVAPTTVPATTAVPSSATPFAGTAICAPAALAVAATTDRTTYPPATPVTITVTVSNRSAATCQFQPTAGPAGIVGVADPAGSAVWEPRRVSAPSPSPFYLLRAGAGFMAGTVVWDQHGCPPPCTGPGGATVGRGRYHVVPTVAGAATAVAADVTLR